MKILALDYDGVLVDSRKETFVVAYNIYAKLYGFKNYSNELLSFKNFSRLDAELKELEEEFYRMRPFCGHVCAFSSVMDALDKGIRFKDKDEFEKYRAKCVEDKDFRWKYHEERKRLQNENFSAFLELSPAHKSIIDYVKKLIPLFDEVFILTGNRNDLVSKVLNAYDLDFPIDKIFDADFMDDKKIRNKKVMMDHIISMTGAKASEIVFVEDQFAYLESVLSLGVKAFLVDWGFDNEENRDRAREKGIMVLSKGRFLDVIKKEISNL